MRHPSEFAAHPEAFPEPVFRAFVRHVVDGDTVDVLADVGFNLYPYLTVRVRGVDTPEINRAHSRVAGLAAKQRTAELVLNQPVLLRTEKDVQTFGRYVADVFYRRGDEWVSLAQTLIDEGFGEPA